MTQLNRILVLSLCIGLSALWAASIRSARHPALESEDFGAIYYSTRCALEHRDPYDPQEVLRELKTDGQTLPSFGPMAKGFPQAVITKSDYPPTAFLAVAPLAMLSWPTALKIWLGVMEGLLVLAGYLAWDLAGDAPWLAGCIACFMLLNCEALLVTGNPAGVVVPFVVVGAWCFMKERFAWAGVVALALALVLKPHDAGFIWFYFLLAGGTGRKCALQTLAVVGILAACAAVWIAPDSPHWIEELQRNLAQLSAPGGPANPGPARMWNRSFGMIDLQVIVSVFKDEPHFYNLVSYLIGGGPILTWAVAVMRKRATREGALLGLAAISLLSLPAFYHWAATDAKLLLLTLPACGIFWARKWPKRWIALGLTSAAIFITSDVPFHLWAAATASLTLSPSSFGGKMLLVLLYPVPLVLLAAGCFYLWVYIRYRPDEGTRKADVMKAAAAAASWV
jgi:hypothetical protein